VINKYLAWLAGLVLASTAAAQIVPVENLKPPAASTKAPPYYPLTNRQRWEWVIGSTLGPESLAAGLFTAGLGTASDSPVEYGPHWDGFAKRYGMRLTGISTGKTIEAGIGSLWNEDPRYFRASGQPLKIRLKNVMVMTFAARRSEGTLAPAYARYIGNAGSSFLSNTWRVDSQTQVSDACSRIAMGFVGKIASNAFAEFWPDARKHISHKKKR